VGLELVERRQKKIFKTQLNKELTLEHLKAMDGNEDGKVESEEYILFMLVETGLVNKTEIEELCGQIWQSRSCGPHADGKAARCRPY
jgi:hypothetical protein